MKTSQKTREYWVGKAKEWAEGFMTHPDYDGSPQLDEFNAVMDELMGENLALDAANQHARACEQKALAAEARFQVLWDALDDIIAQTGETWTNVTATAAMKKVDQKQEAKKD